MGAAASVQCEHTEYGNPLRYGSSMLPSFAGMSICTEPREWQLKAEATVHMSARVPQEFGEGTWEGRMEAGLSRGQGSRKHRGRV